MTMSLLVEKFTPYMCFSFSVSLSLFGGWSAGAKVLGKLPVRGVQGVVGWCDGAG